MQLESLDDARRPGVMVVMGDYDMLCKACHKTRNTERGKDTYAHLCTHTLAWHAGATLRLEGSVMRECVTRTLGASEGTGKSMMHSVNHKAIRKLAESGVCVHTVNKNYSVHLHTAKTSI
jgi:adenylylsulfate kinase-like enzyme